MRCSTLKSHGRIVLFLSAVALAAAGEFPAWAYPVPDPGPAPIPPAEAVLRVPDSPVVLTPRDLAAHGPAVPDWHPAEHPAMPDIVVRGREPQVWACAYCHLPSGAGRPENASLAGLSATYIKQQLAAFKNGERPGAEPRRAPQNFMIALAKAATDEEIAVAANYFAALRPASFVRVVEAATVPKTYVAGAMLARVPGGGEEPIGGRIIEVPEELERAEKRDARTTYVAYVPVGSVQRGADLALTGGAGKTQVCATCHGPELRGLADVPRLAGRSPSYLMRQLYDVRHSARTGPGTVPMQAVVANLTTEDLVALAAYVATREP